jgi:hypothetical protein
MGGSGLNSLVASFQLADKSAPLANLGVLHYASGLDPDGPVWLAHGSKAGATRKPCTIL